MSIGLPISQRNQLSNPRGPAQSGPFWRFMQSIPDRINRLTTWRPPSEEQIATTAGIRYRPQFGAAFAGLPFAPGQNVDAKYTKLRDGAILKRLRDAQAGQPDAALRLPVRLRPGLGGVDYAQAIRYKPGARDGYAGGFRMPEPQIFGRKPPGAPPEAWNRLKDDRFQYRNVQNEPIYPVTEPAQVPPVPRSQPVILMAGVLFLFFMVKK